MLMFADKVGGWGWPNADVSTKKVHIQGKNSFFCSTFIISTFFCVIFMVIYSMYMNYVLYFNKNKPSLILASFTY